jgi:uncharacterized protein YndB with AHSA1/START domain
MAADKSAAGAAVPAVTLIVRRTILATPARLFAAWTQPAQLRQWWGPEAVECVDAQVDLRVGGRYRIANRFPDGTILWIVGEYEVIDAPHRLVYSWGLEPLAGAPERVTVEFVARGEATEVIVTHEAIPNASIRERHEQGWQGCLEGLARYLLH